MNNFNIMVDEAYKILNNDNFINNIILPKIECEINSTRLYWKNIIKYLDIINRSHEHFLLFLKNELYNKEINWYSANKNDGIIIHGKYIKQSQISDLIKKYINLFVICPSCKNTNTELNKMTIKKYEFKCLACKMTKIVII